MSLSYREMAFGVRCAFCHIVAAMANLRKGPIYSTHDFVFL